MEKRPYTKEVVILVGTKSGSMHENDKVAGITHFIEHMLFRTNQWRTTQEVTDELESAGAEINAYTDQDSMCFYAKTLPSEISKTFRIIFEAAINKQYQKDEFLREKDAILSEIKLGVEDHFSYVYSNLFIPTLFKGTGLQGLVPGTAKTVGGLTPRQLLEYKKMIFVPNKPMAVVVVGQFKEEQVVGEIRKTFGTLPEGLANVETPIPVLNEKFRVVEKRKGIDQAYLAMGFRVPGQLDPDMFKLALLEGILTGGMSCRLFRELRDKRGIGYMVGSELGGLDGVGSFCFVVSVYDPQRLAEVEEVIRAELHDLKTNLVGAYELEKAKNLIVRSHYDALEMSENRANRILMHEFQKIPYDFRKFDQYIRRLSSRSVREAAQKYFTENYILAALIPE
jgi:predicted Zn-dependent peptidase